MIIGTYYCVSTYKGGLPAGFSGFVPASSSPVSSTPIAKSTSVTTGISTPSPIQRGMVSTCNKFYKVITDDSCYDIANDNGIALSSFYSWNPGVKTDCSGLKANEYVCITGMVSNCNAFYEVVSDDPCYDIANDHGVSLFNFYAWNPAVNTDCSGLQVTEHGFYMYKFYKVVPGDSCVDIASEYGISTSSFYAWNPAVKTDCTGLQADEYVCVAVA
ncbi:hypothetical protein N7504_006309 [Penicillium tannophilum]|nr:hypothetical protein N7504_006309 [Penicillium tannophilum]